MLVPTRITSALLHGRTLRMAKNPSDITYGDEETAQFE
jgi:hypothetical protein